MMEPTRESLRALGGAERLRRASDAHPNRTPMHASELDGYCRLETRDVTRN